MFVSSSADWCRGGRQIIYGKNLLRTINPRQEGNCGSEQNWWENIFYSFYTCDFQVCSRQKQPTKNSSTTLESQCPIFNPWDILLISIPQSQDQKFWEKLIYWNKNYQEQVLTTYLSWINSCSSLIHWFWRIFWSCDRHKTRNSLVSWLWY